MHSLPDMNELMKIAASPAGQKLLALLQNSAVDMTRLSQDASTGNYAAVKSQLAGILASDDAQHLLKQLENRNE